MEIGLRYVDKLPGSKVRELIGTRYAELKELYEAELTAEPTKEKIPAWETSVHDYRLYRMGAEVRWLKNQLAWLKKL